MANADDAYALIHGIPWQNCNLFTPMVIPQTIIKLRLSAAIASPGSIDSSWQGMWLTEPKPPTRPRHCWLRLGRPPWSLRNQQRYPRILWLKTVYIELKQLIKKVMNLSAEESLFVAPAAGTVAPSFLWPAEKLCSQHKVCSVSSNPQASLWRVVLKTQRKQISMKIECHYRMPLFIVPLIFLISVSLEVQLHPVYSSHESFQLTSSNAMASQCRIRKLFFGGLPLHGQWTRTWHCSGISSIQQTMLHTLL